MNDNDPVNSILSIPQSQQSAHRNTLEIPKPNQTTLTTIAPKAITGHFEPRELPRLQTALTKPATLVLTGPMSIVKKVISHQRSTIVVMDDGCGKTTMLERLGEELWGEVPDETTELLDPDKWVCITQCYPLRHPCQGAVGVDEIAITNRERL